MCRDEPGSLAVVEVDGSCTRVFLACGTATIDDGTLVSEGEVWDSCEDEVRKMDWLVRWEILLRRESVPTAGQQSH